QHQYSIFWLTLLDLTSPISSATTSWSVSQKTATGSTTANRGFTCRRVGAPSSTTFRPVMGRLTGIERPCEPSPTSYGTRAKAGATRPAPGGLWEPQKAYRSRNLTRIQVNNEPSAGGHGCSAPD
ncbi:hypothetical protein THAOC_05351, partial [Thalassiosira oceanica]